MFDLGMFFPFSSFSISDIINQCLMAKDNLLTLQTHFLFKHAIWKQIFFCLPQGINFHIDFMVISSKCHILPYKQYLGKTEDEFSGKTRWRNWITILRSFLITLCVRLVSFFGKEESGWMKDIEFANPCRSDHWNSMWLWIWNVIFKPNLKKTTTTTTTKAAKGKSSFASWNWMMENVAPNLLEIGEHWAEINDSS